jgi:hypothetical protein
MEDEMKVEGSTRFEDTVVEIRAGLKAVTECGTDLLAAIPDPAHMLPSPEGDAFAELGTRRLALLVRQKSVYPELAAHVAGIGAAIDEQRAIFNSRENPLASDFLIGLFSKRTMRRRIEKRAARVGGVERLRTILGRADRLAGLIEMHRQIVIGQRIAAEDALAMFAAFKVADAAGMPADHGEGDEGASGHGQALESMVGLVDPVSRAFNSGVRDLNLLLQKLGLDIENLLDLYSVLLSFDREREVHGLVPDAYPHLTQSVWRLGNGLLPGARLERSRQRTDTAFAKRFEDA